MSASKDLASGSRVTALDLQPGLTSHPQAGPRLAPPFKSFRKVLNALRSFFTVRTICKEKRLPCSSLFFANGAGERT